MRNNHNRGVNAAEISARNNDEMRQIFSHKFVTEFQSRPRKGLNLTLGQVVQYSTAFIISSSRGKATFKVAAVRFLEFRNYNFEIQPQSSSFQHLTSKIRNSFFFREDFAHSTNIPG